MTESKDTFLLFRLWFLAVAVLIAVNLALVSLSLSRAEAISISPSKAYDKIADKSRLPSLTPHLDVGKFARGAMGDVMAVARAPIRIAGVITHPGSWAAFIKPAETDKTPVPVISASPGATPTVATSAGATSASQPQWPIHGAITTAFGVSEWPYERIHTGLDISDGKIAGTTPVRPFLPGVVVGVVYGGGLGNHVVIDHGGGLTSVYGHLNSVSVRYGQTVSQKSVLGYEGSTGVSTGTHLHFEVRQHGQPRDPGKFIRGQP